VCGTGTLCKLFSAKLVIANAIYAKQNIQKVSMQIQILIPPWKFVSSERKKIFVYITLVFCCSYFYRKRKKKKTSLWYKILWKLSSLKILCRITVATAAMQVKLVQLAQLRRKKEEEKILSDKYSFCHIGFCANFGTSFMNVPLENMLQLQLPIVVGQHRTKLNGPIKRRM
jgi:hypothetical protein